MGATCTRRWFLRPEYHIKLNKKDYRKKRDITMQVSVHALCNRADLVWSMETAVMYVTLVSRLPWRIGVDDLIKEIYRTRLDAPIALKWYHIIEIVYCMNAQLTFFFESLSVVELFAFFLAEIFWELSTSSTSSISTELPCFIFPGGAARLGFEMV